MNEETPNLEPEKSGLDDKKRNALLRYVAILFAVAFLLVLFSMLMEQRNSNAAMDQLNQSSASALQKAELLQDTNRQLEKDKSYLEGRLEEQEKDLEDLQAQLEESKSEQERLEEQLETQLEAAGQEEISIHRAYELLLQAQAGSGSALKELEQYKAYLGEYALKLYENLIKEGE